MPWLVRFADESKVFGKEVLPSMTKSLLLNMIIERVAFTRNGHVPETTSQALFVLVIACHSSFSSIFSARSHAARASNSRFLPAKRGEQCTDAGVLDQVLQWFGFGPCNCSCSYPHLYKVQENNANSIILMPENIGYVSSTCAILYIYLYAVCNTLHLCFELQGSQC